MKRFLALLLMPLLLEMPVAANVTTGSWFMDQSNTFSDGINYGQVDITADDVTGVVSFTVDAFTGPYTTTNNFGIQTFGFNANVSDPISSWTFNLPTGWVVTGSGNENGFGLFLDNVKGKGNSRQDPLIFDITLPTESGAVASNFAVLSTGGDSQFVAAHVAGFTVEGSEFTSHFIGGPGTVSTVSVPAPGAILLGGTGIGLVGWLRRRRAL